jgi:hypothetical protein
MLASVLLAGCATYYRVTDPASGRQYYTHEIEKSRDGGGVTFKDDRTKSAVTLQNSEIAEISKSDYEKGMAAP